MFLYVEVLGISDMSTDQQLASSRKGASPIRDRITLTRMFFYDPGSRFAWPG